MQTTVNGSATLVMKKLGMHVFFVSKGNTPLGELNHANHVKSVMKMPLQRDVRRGAQATPESVNAAKDFRAAVFPAVFAALANINLVLAYWMKVGALPVVLVGTRQETAW